MKTAEQWNRWSFVGMEVVLVDDFGQEHITKTRSEAWNLGDGTPVVKVEGRSGGYDLQRIHPYKPEERGQ